ncbi:YrhK family protein [Jannaschia donghaensis]|uniref:YrhK domain-containing protein n=1 Tax=Jannaschia donghaensis TaxID=420998 RepID=A0A0M6YK48_9RHOB|nr:YrhK family protein [Jannaschia donghaensis]CTQ49893.1 hypothetical protein JDO7802_01910 [Jannaschia donghaensis]
MTLFRHANRQRSEATKRAYARFELLRTGVDFLAAMLFLTGSILFFWPALETIAIWLFVAGSICFAIKPTLKLWREIHLARQGQVQTLADRERSAD